ncbi:MAG: HEAT repeat domain-containing protein, partial [Planctomycetales bacterium]|nr:HEAT repeat domain-containing protein [Planctomycetales bacterium]
VKTRHVAFRPIDVKMGPDGAIYIADWYNPIIQHGEVDFRDERRDHTHGRIWRITAKGRPLVPRINLEELATDELCEMLASPEPWRVQNAKQVLKHRDRAEVHDNLNRWLAKQDHTSDDYYRRMLQVFWASEAQGVIRHDLLNLLLKCRDPQAKASATRALFHWHDSIPNADEWIELLVNDSHARVRLEAVRAATKMKYPDACQIAMRALDHPVDRFLDFALWTAARDLKSTWVPGLDAGEIDFDGDPNHLIFALKAIEEPNVANRLLALASNTDLSADLRRDILRTVAETSANGNELQQLFDLCLQPSTDGETRNAVLAALVDAAKNRRLKPSGDLNALATLLQRSGGGTADIENVLRLAGLWRISSLRSELFNIAAQAKRDGNVIASLDGLAAYGDELAMKMLSEFAAGHSETVFRSAAAARTMLVDANAGSRIVAQRLVASLENDDPSEMIRLTLRTKKGPDLLATALAGKSVHPEVARSALNELGSSGLTATSLTSALRKAGGLEMRRGWVMSDAERLAFLAEVEAKGYPAAGERIFRRSKMACQKCHAIGGAGGQVGPDLASIGASAQADYILESLVEPNKKIKENYHSLIIVDQDGQVFTGIKIRETNDSLLLRTAENQILNIPLKSIDERADGGSLMPAGLADTLTRSELVDLVRYLSELGKIGRYALPREKYARTWRTLSNDERKQKSVETLLASPASDWTDRFSAIDGALPTNDLPALSVGDQRVSVVKCSISLDNPVGFLKITPHSGVHVWMNGNEVADHANLTVPNGEHEVVLVIDRAKSIPNVSIQISN